MPDKVLNDILNKIQNPQNKAMGRPSSYPGIPDSGDDEEYTTYRQASDYNTRSQQPIESTSNEDYGVKTPSGKELLVDADGDEEDLDSYMEGMLNEQGEGEEASKTGEDELAAPEPEEKTKKKDEDNEEYSSTEIGRIYELKKIYSRLLSIEGYLNVSNDEELMKLRNYAIQAIDLFKTLVYNINKFMDEIDDIIIYYYNFLLKMYETIRKRLKEIDNDKEEK